MDLEAAFVKIQTVKWQELVHRTETPLFRSLTDTGYAFFAEATGVPWTCRWSFRLSQGEALWNAEELASLRQLFSDGGSALLARFLQRLVREVSAFDRFATFVAEQNIGRLSQRQLTALLDRYFQKALRVHNFLVPVPVAGNVLSNMILERLPPAAESQRQQWLSELSYPTKENSHTEEERAFYRLADAKKRGGTSFDRALARHARTFGWIGARGYWWNRAWTVGHLRARVNEFTAQGKSPAAELRHLNAIRTTNRRATRALFKALALTPRSELVRLTTLAKEYAYVRTWRTDVLYRAGHTARALFFDVARRAGVSTLDIPYYTWTEFLTVARSGHALLPRGELRLRKKAISGGLVDGTFVDFPGVAWEKRLRAVMTQKPPLVAAVRGTTAHGGTARGIVRRVFSGLDLPKVQRGDILVTVMTFPNYVPAMEKAAAFVTDEGGILCHAAIVAREMRKPCIIGTKVATKVLRDGDKVEVHAEEGIVRVLKRARA